MRRTRSKLQVSTFPFLAVLLAAMGALILLLLVMDRRAKLVVQNKARETWEARQRERAEREAKRLAAWQREQDELQRQEEEAQREHAILAQRRAQEEKSLRAELTDVQSKLQTVAATLQREDLEANRLIEDQANLQKRLAESSRNLEARRKLGSMTKEQEDAAAQVLAKMTADLTRMERILRDLKSRPKNDNVFSLVPYRGKQGENRKPIYVECAASGIVFQPHGRRLSIVAMDLGRIREEIRRAGLEVVPTKETPKDGIPRSTTAIAKTDPYLLCLVRPDGVETYGRLLKVLKGYDIDFGYELIDAHWKLDFSNDRLAGAEPARESPTRKLVTGVPTSRPGTGGSGPGQTREGGSSRPDLGRAGSPFPGAVPGSQPRLGMGGPGIGSPIVSPGKPGEGTTATFPTKKKKSNLGGAGTTAVTATPVGLVKVPGARSGTDRRKKDDTAWRGSKASRQEDALSEEDRPKHEGRPGARNGEEGEPRDSHERPLPRDPLAKRSPRPPSLGHLLANRDFVIHIACTETEAIIKLTGEGFATNGSIPEQTKNGLALVDLVRKLIARRQTSLRPGEDPYRPQIRFQVYPGGLRTYYRIYPLFENLGIPMTRENIEL